MSTLNYATTSELDDSVVGPNIPRDYACRATDRPAEHGPHAATMIERVLWVAGGLVLIAFWSFALLAALDRVPL